MSDYGKEYAQEVLRRQNERLQREEMLRNEHNMLHSMSLSVNTKHSMLHNMQEKKESWKQLNKFEYATLLNQLDAWGVFASKAIVRKYGALVCWQAMKSAKMSNASNKGAYFTKVARELA